MPSVKRAPSRKAAPAGGQRSPRDGAHVVGMQRRRLLLAMCELLNEGGIESASVGRVCSRAGVSRRTFYELFHDREDCFVATFDHVVESVRVAVADVYARPGGWRKRMRSALGLLLERLDDEATLARVCVVESLRAGSEVLEHRNRLLAVLAKAVDEGRGESRLAAQAPQLTAQGVVGGVLAVIHAHTLEGKSDYTGLLGQLMAMIVHPYLGTGAAREELKHSVPGLSRPARRTSSDPFKDLPIRFTYRTARVLETIASKPGASNRYIAGSSGVTDEGQISRLLRRLCACELIENRSEGQIKGEPNAWALTERGAAVHAAIGTSA